MINLANLGHNLVVVFFSIVIVPSLLTIGLSTINRRNKQLIVNYWGVKSQLWFGGIGVIIHELSHLMMALLFGHKITQVTLLNVPTPENPTLGSVRHSWNEQNKYQQLGNFFIGLAPIIGCSLTLLGLSYLLVPGLLSSLLATFTDTIDIVDQNLIWWKMILFIIISLNIVCGGFDLSRADLSNAGLGVGLWLLFLLIITLLLSVIVPTGSWLVIFTNLGWLIGLTLGYSLLLSLVVWLFLKTFS